MSSYGNRYGYGAKSGSPGRVNNNRVNSANYGVNKGGHMKKNMSPKPAA